MLQSRCKRVQDMMSTCFFNGVHFPLNLPKQAYVVQWVLLLVADIEKQEVGGAMPQKTP